MSGSMEIDGKFYVYLLLVVAETFVLLWFSFLPSVDFIRTGFTRLGDLEHFIAYTVYGFLLHRVFGYFFSRRESVVFSVAVGSLVGGGLRGLAASAPLQGRGRGRLGDRHAGFFCGGTDKFEI